MSAPRLIPHKKAGNFSIKRADGEPLTRLDLQFDLLHHIFYDEHQVFTDPYATLDGRPPRSKVTFRDLYINYILHSPKATKVLKDKMADLPDFATDFAMLALLTNVGRINTTMSFFTEMRTAMRSYHPIPALQRTNGNLQDAPRIRQLLKTCILDGEDRGISTPNDILQRSRSGMIPPTSVMNLLFIMASHAAPLAHLHFPENHDFLDIFLPSTISSASRARAFLWLCYHYLEAPSSDDDDDYDGDPSSLNPFSDTTLHPGKMPAFVFLSPEEAALENVDSEEEKAHCERILSHRSTIVRNLANKASASVAVNSRMSASVSVMGDDDDDAASVSTVPDVKPKGKRGGARAKPSVAAKEKKAAGDKVRRAKLKERQREERDADMPLPHPENPLNEQHYESFPLEGGHSPYSQQYQYHPSPTHRHHSTSTQTRTRPLPSPEPTYRRVSITPDPPNLVKPNSQRYDPYRLSPGPSSRQPLSYPDKSRHRSQHSSAPRSMLEHAWHVITTTDPLHDSDDEADEHVRADYLKRFHVLSHLHGREPTPEPV